MWHMYASVKFMQLQGALNSNWTYTTSKMCSGNRLLKKLAMRQMTGSTQAWLVVTT